MDGFNELIQRFELSHFGTVEENPLVIITI